MNNASIDISVEQFTLLPGNIQKDAQDTLVHFDRVYITRENGTYSVATGFALKQRYADDDLFFVCTDEAAYPNGGKPIAYCPRCGQYLESDGAFLHTCPCCKATID